MKHNPCLLLFLTILLSLLSSCHDDRGKAAEDVFEQYAGEAGVYIFRIPPGLIGIFVNAEENPELKQSLRKMEMIKVMIFDQGKAGKLDKQEILQGFNEKLEENQFSDLLLATEGKQVIRIKYREDEEGIIQEMMIMVTEEESFLGLSMVGVINLDQLTEIARSLEIENFK
jgi:hypothetical protein